jgi:hypothetical protein
VSAQRPPVTFCHCLGGGLPPRRRRASAKLDAVDSATAPLPGTTSPPRPRPDELATLRKPLAALSVKQAGHRRRRPGVA